MQSSIKPSFLKCEHRTNPAGIDSKHPRFSWITEYSQGSAVQSAYRILISSSLDLLSEESGDIWDSGKVESSESVLVLFQEVPLISNKTYYWKVMVWVGNNLSSWSEPARFSTGLFEQSEWKGKWICHRYKEEEPVLSFQPGSDKWIWFPYYSEKDKYQTIILRKLFTVNNSGQIESALLLVTADEKYILSLNGEVIAQSDDKIFSWARPLLIDVKAKINEGVNVFKADGFNSYVEEPGFIVRLQVKYKSGETVTIISDETWTASIKGTEENVVSAKVVKLAGEKPWRLPYAGLKLNPAAYFRKEFKTPVDITRAYLYCSALGLYNIKINDRPVTFSKFSPVWSDFNNSAYYKSFDVTNKINSPGHNRIDVILADGFYAGYCGWEKGRGYYGKYPALKLQLIIIYENGSEDIIATGEDWVSSEGPILEADVLMGETYDSSKESMMSFQNVVSFENINVKLTSYGAEDVKIRKELTPINKKRVDVEKHIIDFGQNFAGFVRLKLHNIKSTVVLKFAEVLNPDGTLYLDNIRMARAQDTYIAKGLPEEIWEPLFTYHGFRYVEVSGLETIEEDTLTGISINSLPEQTTFFESSNEKLNKLYECILWNQRSNYIDIPTDCPQRDERLGWTGDAVSYFRTAAFNHDVSAFYTKWFQDIFNAQRPDGALPPFAPLPDLGVGPVYYNAAGWADAGVIAPWQFYEFYNDREVLNKYYPKMKLFMESLIKRSDNYIFPDDGYGDWLFIGEETLKSFIASAYFAFDCTVMNRIADVLDKKEDMLYFSDLFNKVKQSFRNNFSNADGSLKQRTQTAAVLAIQFGLLEEKEKLIAADFLVNDIIERKFHLSTGFLGLSFIMPVLSSLNRNNVAWKLLTNNEFPSWFYMIDNGATTLWERWDSYHHEKGFFDPTMNSFNHCTLGCVGEWLITGLGGINLIEPGFKKILIKPYIPVDLEYLSVSFKSIYGFIKSEWRKESNQVKFKITIPFNTNAIISLPNNPPKEVGSGTYEFIIPIS